MLNECKGTSGKHGRCAFFVKINLTKRKVGDIMQETICAKVSERLLSKASRLFTGTQDGRIIEILQNARRAGATEVRISNKDGLITVADNGSGIDDFQKLLDLGGSGWDEKLEAGEDPAGVGLFSLTPRKVTIISGSRQTVIDKDGWTGKPVEVTEISEAVNGTILKFRDESPWNHGAVEKHAVFAGIRVVVDGKICHSMRFCSEQSVDYPELGCRIEVVSDMSKYHQQWTTYYYQSKALVNFHGQIVELDYWPGKFRSNLHVLVDLTEQTQMRLMLPARTKLVENEALKRLKDAIEIEYYRYFQRQKEHTLYYDEYLRAKELDIELAEAEPKYDVGLICDENGMAVEMTTPKDFRLCDAYLCFDKDMDDEKGNDNVHLLAALGTFKEKPFVPVSIQSGYMGYSWSKLPKITSVKVTAGKERLRRMILNADLICVESLSIEVEASDGSKFASVVSMAVVNEPPTGKYNWLNEAVYITESARGELDTNNLWYHLGSYSDEGDTYETQQYCVEKDLDEFWNELIGPYETARQKLIKELYPLHGKWQKVTIFEDSSLEILFKDGRKERVKPPA